MWDVYRFAVAVVVLHTGVTAVHAAAHVGLGISPPIPDAIFIAAVFFGLPIVSVAFLRKDVRVTSVFTVAFLAGLVYGGLSHFVLAGPDNAIGLPPSGWATVFQVTTVALAVMEALGVLTGGILVARPRTPSGPAGPPT